MKEKTWRKLKTQCGGGQEEMPGVGLEFVQRIKIAEVLNLTGQRSSCVGLFNKKQCLFAALHHIVLRIESEIKNKKHRLVPPFQKKRKHLTRLTHLPSPGVYWEKTKAGRIIIHMSHVYTIDATLLHQQSHGHAAWIKIIGNG